MVGEMKTQFDRICLILSELWLNHKKDPVFIEFIEYNDLGLPLAYAINEGIVEKTDIAEKFVRETFELLLAGVAVEDSGFENLKELLQRAEANTLAKLENQESLDLGKASSVSIQELLDEVWSKFDLSSDWWNNQPDAAYSNEMSSVIYLAGRLKEVALDPQVLVDAVEKDTEFSQDRQKQTLEYALLAWESNESKVLDKFKNDLIEDGLDFYTTYWIAHNPSSSSVHLQPAAEYALDSEDSELLELLIANPNLKASLRDKCAEMLDDLE
jgi:hypothetical protein